MSHVTAPSTKVYYAYEGYMYYAAIMHVCSYAPMGGGGGGTEWVISQRFFKIV